MKLSIVVQANWVGKKSSRKQQQQQQQKEKIFQFFQTKGLINQVI